MNETAADNYRYWQESGRGWFDEYNNRKRSSLYFHIQELFLAEYVAKHAPAKILEYGCGVGRHLQNLKDLPDIEPYGYDQSATMVAEMSHWASHSWIESHIRLGPPTGRLPFADGEFDVVFTCEVLVHTRPEDLEIVLRELLRVSRGKILHLEPGQGTNLVTEAHSGCWAHDLPAAYRRLGKSADTLPKLYHSQELIEVILRTSDVHPSVFTAIGSAILRRMEEDITPNLNRGTWEENLSATTSVTQQEDLDSLTSIPEEQLRRTLSATSRGQLEQAVLYLAGQMRELSQGLASQVEQLVAHECLPAVLPAPHERLRQGLRDTTANFPNDSETLGRHRFFPFHDLKCLGVGLRTAFQERSAARLALELEHEAAESVSRERDHLARHVMSLENKLRYIETRTSFRKVKALRQSRIVSALLTTLRVVSSPIVIDVLPKRNSASKGHEVWLRSVRPDPEGPALPWSMVSLRDDWKPIQSLGCTDDLALVGYGGTVVLPGGRDPVLSFMMHPWSGCVRLGWNGREKFLDLYAAEATEVTVRLGDA